MSITDSQALRLFDEADVVTRAKITAIAGKVSGADSYELRAAIDEIKTMLVNAKIKTVQVEIEAALLAASFDGIKINRSDAAVTDPIAKSNAMRVDDAGVMWFNDIKIAGAGALRSQHFKLTGIEPTDGKTKRRGLVGKIDGVPVLIDNYCPQAAKGFYYVGPGILQLTGAYLMSPVTFAAEYGSDLEAVAAVVRDYWRQNPSKQPPTVTAAKVAWAPPTVGDTIMVHGVKVLINRLIDDETCAGWTEDHQPIAVRNYQTCQIVPVEIARTRFVVMRGAEAVGRSYCIAHLDESAAHSDCAAANLRGYSSGGCATVMSNDAYTDWWFVVDTFSPPRFAVMRGPEVVGRLAVFTDSGRHAEHDATVSAASFNARPSPSAGHYVEAAEIEGSWFVVDTQAPAKPVPTPMTLSAPAQPPPTDDEIVAAMEEEIRSDRDIDFGSAWKSRGMKVRGVGYSRGELEAAWSRVLAAKVAAADAARKEAERWSNAVQPDDGEAIVGAKDA